LLGMSCPWLSRLRCCGCSITVGRAAILFTSY
jgi:hypothetical protein